MVLGVWAGFCGWVDLGAPWLGVESESIYKLQLRPSGVF